MARMKVWREVVTKALRGGPWTNAETYKRVAHEIGSKELTSNQKAKVRQQLQLVGKRPKGVKKGKYRLAVKLPPKKALDKVSSHASSFGFLSNPEIGEREKSERYHKDSRLFVHEYDVTDDIDTKALVEIARDLEKLYGKVDCAIHFLFEVRDATTNEKIEEKWLTMTYGGTPIIAAQQLPGKFERLEKNVEGLYRLHNILKLSFLIFVPV